MMRRASSAGKGGSLSCNSARSAAMASPTRSDRVDRIWPSLMKLGPRSRSAAASRSPGRPGTSFAEIRRANEATPGATSRSSCGKSASWRPSVRMITIRRTTLRIVRIIGTFEPVQEKGSEPPAGMDRRDAAGQVAVAHLTESGRFDPSHQTFLIGELADALDQILVRLAVAGHQLAQPWQDRERVPVIDVPQNRQDNPAELQAEETPARFQHAVGFGQRRVDPGYVPQAEGDGIDIDRPALQRHLLRIADDPVDPVE